MSDYIDNVVIKLKRRYGKDELVQAMIKKQSQLETEIGILKSEKDELEYLLNKEIKSRNQKIKSKFGNTEVYKNLKAEIKALREGYRKLKIENTKLFSDLARRNAP